MDFEVFCEKIWGNVRDDNGGVWEAGVSAPAGAGNGFPRQCEHWLGMTGFFDSLTSLTEEGFERGQAKYFSLKGMFSTVKVQPRR